MKTGKKLNNFGSPTCVGRGLLTKPSWPSHPVNAAALKDFASVGRPSANEAYTTWSMEIGVFLKGLAIGFSIAAPVGPIGVLCIRRTLAEGRASGLLSGLGAATADAVYGCVAGFGLTFISNTLISQQMWLRLVGGVFLCYLGFKTLLARPAEETIPAGANGPIGAYASTFFLTLTNPMTILSFAAIFASLEKARGDYVSAAVLVLGVFIGSALWWLTLSTGVSMLRTKFTSHRLRWVNRISGLVIVAFGAFALLR